jgi:hypothetical protein
MRVSETAGIGSASNPHRAASNLRRARERLLGIAGSSLVGEAGGVGYEVHVSHH